MEDCIFCKIAAGIIPSNKVFEDELVFAFRDIHPMAPTHILIIPKKHYQNLSALDAADQTLQEYLLHIVNLIAQQEGLDKGGYRVAINCGKWGGQVVQHLHIHLLGGRKLVDELG
ncbi:MAG: histidine triad nucleotide-binding protein [Dehalococcoidia bacterium]|nr:histidine triad nucleotide-binding protein [Dehalococcoidia bacterium]